MPWYEYSALRPGRPRPLVTVQLWHGPRAASIVALVDSGADHSLFDVRFADLLGLDRAGALLVESVGASGSAFPTYRWPSVALELQFERERIPFFGAFAAFPASADVPGLVGRADFFQPFIVQFWDAAGLMNIDLSPDFPQPPLGR